MIYAAQFDTMNALLGYLTENCCGGATECVRPLSQAARKRTEDRRQDRSHSMKRLHVHVAVNDLIQSVGFYSALFAAIPPL